MFLPTTTAKSGRRLNTMPEITTIRCPHCNTPLSLTGGNIMFSFWQCKKCQKGFQFNVLLEKFTDEWRI